MLSNHGELANKFRARGSRPLRKVCLLIGQLGRGGTEKQVLLLARGLHDRKIDISVLVLFEGGPLEGELRQTGIRVIHFGFRRLGTVRTAATNMAAFARLVAHLRREKPDVLHAFLLHSYLLAAPAARMAGLPVLVAGRRSLGTFKEGHRFALTMERLATRATDLLIANAHAVAEDTIRREGVVPEKIAVVYNGLPESAFDKVPPASVDTLCPVVLCVANLRVYKGHSYLLEAINHLYRHGRKCTLLLAGDGDQQYALEQQAGALGIDVRFLGSCPDVRPMLARADVIVLPSLHEGMSNAVMEAMAAGRPVVATNVGGTPELLRGRGILVAPADPGAMASAIELLLDDRARASSLGVQARSWGRTHLSADHMVDEHVRIYSYLLGNSCAE
jgi:L-malate glycosyltransferase